MEACHADGQLRVGSFGHGESWLHAAHEHLLDSSAGIPHTYDELINREWALEAATEELTRAHSEGVDTIVEVSPMNLGRDVKLMYEVSQRTGVQFICCTGCWLDISRSFLNRTPDVIASLWVREIEEGIEGTGIKAGIIKVATSDPIPEPEELMLRAAARAHHHPHADQVPDRRGTDPHL